MKANHFIAPIELLDDPVTALRYLNLKQVKEIMMSAGKKRSFVPVELLSDSDIITVAITVACAILDPDRPLVN